jgi:GNAT superfamily N-acetyltransferase
MEIVDLTDSRKPIYLACLEDWSEEAREGVPLREIWYSRMRDKGLCVKLALDGRGETGGMIQYLPAEYSPVEGRDLYFVTCVWVHGHKKGRGNFQKKGMGKALIQAAEADVKAKGAGGIAAWGISYPFWMRASWFKKQGYVPVDKEGMMVLMWKPFSQDAAPPRWVRRVKKPEAKPGVVTVSAFVNGWCLAQNMVFERAKRAAAEFGDRVVFEPIDTWGRDVFREWGISDALFIDGREIRTGPPPSYEKIRRKIARKVKRLSR